MKLSQFKKEQIENEGISFELTQVQAESTHGAESELHSSGIERKAIT